MPSRPAERHGERSAAGLLTPSSAFGRPRSLVRKRSAGQSGFPPGNSRTSTYCLRATRGFSLSVQSCTVYDTHDGDEEVSHVGSTVEHGRSSRLDPQRLRALSSEALTAGQISVRSGIPRSSVQRILQQLVSARWLKRHDDGYASACACSKSAAWSRTAAGSRRAARPFIHELAERTGHVVHLAVLDQQDVVYLDKVGSASPLPTRCPPGSAAASRPTAPRSGRRCWPTRPGHRQRVPGDGPAPADAGEPGDAGRPRGGDRQRSATRDTPTERDEAVPGVACVAAPIRNFDEVVAAVSVCGPRDQVRAKDLRPLVMWTAAEISRSLMTAASPLALACPCGRWHGRDAQRPEPGRGHHGGVRRRSAGAEPR